ncbi:ankyrin repeat domain-containing protein [Thioalkalivibrio sp. HK1]|uniref:ankyrin repeat domain-containing protein n=1 Tax=Thioalkalivibrio sp. HK1 TaxID=1469245 RepID=UPI0004714DA7|nr:ankyrin repeat domain-containing protein [Thioalkalivibrio sp. HK1]
MSHHQTLEVRRPVCGGLLCAIVGSLALCLAPVSVSAQPPPITNLICTDNSVAERTKFSALLGHIAAKNTAQLKQVISQSPNIVIECHAGNGFNALHYAASYAYTEGVKILIAAGADRRKRGLLPDYSPCLETPYGIARIMNRFGVGEHRSAELLALLDYDPRNVSWVAGNAGGSATGDSDEEVGGTADSDEGAVATSDTCNARDNEIRRWVAGRTH